MVPAAGVPPRTPVAGLKVTPLGSAPDSLNVGAGKPAPVTVKELANVLANETLVALEMLARWSIVNVKLCVKSGLVLLCAVMTRL